MYRTRKPVHKCYSCLLNLGDHCWRFEDPRDQWHGRASCPGFEDEALYEAFREWQRGPHVKSARELRQDAFRRGPGTEEHHTHFGGDPRKL